MNLKEEFMMFYNQRRFSMLTTPHPPKELKMFENFYSVKSVETTLQENHMLFIPAGWFYIVMSNDDNVYGINCAVSLFTEYDKCLDCDLHVNKVYNL